MIRVKPPEKVAVCIEIHEYSERTKLALINAANGITNKGATLYIVASLNNILEQKLLRTFCNAMQNENTKLILLETIIQRDLLYTRIIRANIIILVKDYFSYPNNWYDIITNNIISYGKSYMSLGPCLTAFNRLTYDIKSEDYIFV